VRAEERDDARGRRAALLTALSAAVAPACDASGTALPPGEHAADAPAPSALADAGETPPDLPVPGASFAPTFSAIYREVFVPAGCTLGLCHGEGARGGRLDLFPRADAHAALVGVVSTSRTCGGQVLVVPRDPDASLLVQKLDGTPRCGAPMPPDVVLPPAHLEQVRSWIVRGAPND